MASQSSLLVGDIDIAKLTDEELYEHLTAHGATVGPIIHTTRNTYERKLAVLMGAQVANYSLQEQTFTEQNNSELDTDVQPSQAYIEQLSSGQPVRRRHVRKESPEPAVVQDTEHEEEELDSAASSRLYAPEARPPLRSYNTSSASCDLFPYSPTTRASSFSPVTASSPRVLSPPSAARYRGGPTHGDDSLPQVTTSGSGGVAQMLVKLVILALMLAAVYYFFIASAPKDPFASLEHLAKSAADAIEQEKKRVPSKQSP